MLQGEQAAFWRFNLKPIALQVRVAVAQGLYRPQGYERVSYGFGDPNWEPVVWSGKTESQIKKDINEIWANVDQFLDKP